MEEQVEQEHPESQEPPEQQDEDGDLTPVEHELAMNKAYDRQVYQRRTLISYIERLKPLIKDLIEEQLRELKSGKDPVKYMDK